MKHEILPLLVISLATGILSCSQQPPKEADSIPQTITISKEKLLDKIGYKKEDLIDKAVGQGKPLAWHMAVRLNSVTEAP